MLLLVGRHLDHNIRSSKVWQILLQVTGALQLIWASVFEHFCENREGVSNFGNFILSFKRNVRIKSLKARNVNECIVGKLHGAGLALHHAVPVEAVPAVLAWDAGAAGLGAGEFYPGRPLLPRLAQHRPQARDRGRNTQSNNNNNNRFIITVI